MWMRHNGVGNRLRIANLVSITLFAEEQLPTEGKVLFNRVAADQRVEVGLVVVRLGTQDPTQPLRFLLSGAESA